MRKDREKLTVEDCERTSLLAQVHALKTEIVMLRDQWAAERAEMVALHQSQAATIQRLMDEVRRANHRLLSVTEVHHDGSITIDRPMVVGELFKTDIAGNRIV